MTTTVNVRVWDARLELATLVSRLATVESEWALLAAAAAAMASGAQHVATSAHPASNTAVRASTAETIKGLITRTLRAAATSCPFKACRF